LQRVFQELGLPVPGGLAIGKLQELRQEILRHDQVYRQRQQLLVELRRQRRRIVRLCLQGKRWARRRQMLLQQVGVTSEVELYRRLEASAATERLRTQIRELDEEITARLCGRATVEEVAAFLQTMPAERLAEARHALRTRLHAAQERLKTLQERQVALDEELAQLAKDATPAARQLDLASAVEQVRQTSHEWQTLAAASFFCDLVRQDYERRRQPDVLRDASRYLAAMTEGKYDRVWTPLDEAALRVDDPHGRTFSVGMLSTGTREQLFLSLRLALAQSYRRQGAELPLVLDDVLVNFDNRRAAACARVLAEVADSGQQILVFTCHEHIAEIFRALHVQVQTLPEHGGELAPTADAQAA